MVALVIRAQFARRNVAGKIYTHANRASFGRGSGGTPKFIGIIKDPAAKAYQEIEFRSGSGANVKAAAASAPA